MFIVDPVTHFMQGKPIFLKALAKVQGGSCNYRTLPLALLLLGSTVGPCPCPPSWFSGQGLCTFSLPEGSRNGLAAFPELCPLFSPGSSRKPHPQFLPFSSRAVFPSYSCWHLVLPLHPCSCCLLEQTAGAWGCLLPSGSWALAISPHFFSPLSASLLSLWPLKASVPRTLCGWPRVTLLERHA